MLGWLAEMVSKIPPLTRSGELATPLILVWTGKIVSGLIRRVESKDCGITVSCAPVSQTDGIGPHLPG